MFDNLKALNDKDGCDIHVSTLKIIYWRLCKIVYCGLQQQNPFGKLLEFNNFHPGKMKKYNNKSILFRYIFMFREEHHIFRYIFMFREEHHIFSYRNSETKSNLLMELAKHANDDALRELLVNRVTYGYVDLNYS